jgi:hypothetical protein
MPQVTLGSDTLICDYASAVLLRPSSQLAGTTYRWQDGLTEEMYLARQASTYRVEVRKAAGYATQAQFSVTVSTCQSSPPMAMALTTTGCFRA